MTFAQDVRDQATHEFDRYLSVVRGTVGLYAAFGPVDRRSFSAYAASLGLAEQYRGLHGLGFAARVAPRDRAAFLAVAKKESGPTFHFWSESEDPATTGPTAIVPPRPQLEWDGDPFVIRYIAPEVGVARRGLGYDIGSDPIRRAAMVRACDTASAIVTPGLRLLRGADGERRPGFVVVVPVFGPAGVPTSVEGRRRDVTGFVFASFRSDDFFSHILNGTLNAQVRLRVYQAAGADADPLLFDTDPPAPGEAFAPVRHRAQFALDFAGSTWSVTATERPTFHTESDAGLVPFILLAGTGLSLVLYSVARGQAIARAEAERAVGVGRQAQRELAASQSRLRRLVDANLIGVFFCDLGGEVTAGNDEFFRLLGQGRGGDGRSLSLADITLPEDHRRVETALQRARQDGVAPAFETAFLRAAGPPTPVLLGVASVDPSDVAGHIPGAEAVAFALDLSDRQRAEHEMRQAKDAAETANRAKDQFLAMLSHELRTPLTPVLAATTAMAGDPSLPQAVRDDLTMVHRNVDLEARLIDDLLDVTRIARGKLQLRADTVDVHAVIADAITVIPPDDIGAKRLTVRSEPLAAAHHVRGDAARLQQVVWNLLKNAVKFTPAGGRITIRTTNEPAPSDGSGPTSDQPQQPSLRLDVVDTGLGIEPEILPKLFDAFEQGSAARAQASGGLGLGLAISRGLVEGQGGRITAESAGTGRGATFSVQLPTVPAPAPSAASVPANDGPPTGAAHRILLVEDHADTARVLSRLLTRAGHAVSVAHCLADAVELVDAQPFDLLISDLGLPDGSGTAIAVRFRQRHAADAGRQPNGDGTQGRTVGAIALTGFGAEDDLQQTRSAGFDEHLTKPVSFDLLELTIARVMAGRERPPGMD